MLVSPYLFAVYTDDLSRQLHKVKSGSLVGNTELASFTYREKLKQFCAKVSLTSSKFDFNISDSVAKGRNSSPI